MNNLGDYLKKFKVLLETPHALKNPLIESLKKKGINLIEKDIAIKEGIAYIASSPAIRSEIFMRKGTILKEVNERLEKIILRDIR